MITHLLDPAAIADPHAVYRDLRAHAPITWLPEHRAWFVATHDAVDHAFRDLRLSSDRLTPLEARLGPDERAVLGETFDLLRGWMVFHDPPAHERLRGPVRRAFTPRTVDHLEPSVETIVDDHLDEIESRLRSGETVDLIESFAFPVPAIVIAEMLGVPASDRDEFKTWSDQLAAIVFGASNRPQQAETAAAGSAMFARYFGELIESYRRRPADNLVCDLIEAAGEADPVFSPTELVGACTLLLFGGHETTTNLIGNSLATLLHHPELIDELSGHGHGHGRRHRNGRARSGGVASAADGPIHRAADHSVRRSVERARAGSVDLDALPNALEELHRYDGSSKIMVRIVGEDHERGGVEMTAGQTVFLGIASANRDPALFPDPDIIDLRRRNAQRHLGYGYGIHYCLGAPLARMETRVAIGRLLGRLPSMTLAVDPSDLTYGATILGRGLTRLPVTLG